MSALDTLGQRLERLAGQVELARPRFDVEPLPLVAPPTVEAAVELVKLASADKLRVIPTGLGSKLGWCATPGHADFLLSTRRLERVVSHVPDDGTLTAEAGITIEELKRRCRDGGHFLTPDLPQGGARTLGGVVAAGESGADRLRFGPLRHHVLGTRTVLADGTPTRSGGQLVKNVTGYDLHRLYCGSHGTLGVIVEVSLRLFPEPEYEAWLTVEAAGLPEALELARAALALPARTVSLTVARAAQAGAGYTVGARLFGLRAVVDAERALYTAAWPRAVALEGLEARQAAERFLERASFAGSTYPKLHATCAVSKLGAVAGELVRALSDARVAHSLSLQPGIAELDVELRSHADDASAVASLAAALRRSFAAHGATLALRDAPRAALLSFDPFGEPAPGLELMRALQRKLDPEGVFSTGRFHGGL